MIILLDHWVSQCGFLKVMIGVKEEAVMKGMIIINQSGSWKKRLDMRRMIEINVMGSQIKVQRK